MLSDRYTSKKEIQQFLDSHNQLKTLFNKFTSAPAYNLYLTLDKHKASKEEANLQ